MGEDMTVHFNMKAAGFVACVAAIALSTGAQAAGWDDGGGAPVTAGRHSLTELCFA